MEESAPARLTPDIQLFRDVFNASPIGIAIEDLEGQPLFLNPAFCSFLGFSEEELRHKHCVDFSPKEDAERDWALFQQLKAGSIDHYQLEKRYFRRDGSSVWGRLSLSLLKNPAFPLVLAMVEDITEKKREEAARDRLAAIVESCEDAIASVTLDGVITTWNAGAQHIYGYTEEEAVGKPFSLVIPPELPDEQNKILEMLRTEGRIDQMETIRFTKTGTRINVSLSISAIKDSSGETVGWSGITRDITERKLAQENLDRTKERLHLAIDSGSVGGWDFDLKSDTSIWFGKAHAQLGIAEGTSASRQLFWDHVHKEDREALRHAIRVARDKHEEFTEEFRVVWSDGTTRWLRSRGRYQYAANGKPHRMLGISIDITETKEAEHALRESEERFRLAAETGKMYSFDWDVTTDIVVRSAERIRIVGPTEPLCFSHAKFIETIHPEDRPKFISATAELTPGNPIAEVVYRVRGSDGTFVWLKSSGRAFFDRKGTMLRVIGMVADISDLKLAEEALSNMTRKLVEAQERERARIARDLHDDISQRLAMLAMNLQQLQIAPSEVQGRLQELRKDVAEIAEDVQSLSHDLHSSKLEYLGVAAGMKSWCKEFAERNGMEIDFKTDVASLIPQEIGVTLFRILQESLHNANKHSGVKRVDIQLREDSGEIHLVVSDSGRGFNVEAASHGRGLGLSSMRERIRLLNGTISIESKPRAGTRIAVRIAIPPKPDSHRAAV